jgi:hypothetical protein
METKLNQETKHVTQHKIIGILYVVNPRTTKKRYNMCIDKLHMLLYQKINSHLS